MSNETIMQPCPLQEDGVHRMGTGTTCACGYTWTVARFHFSIEIHDNATNSDLANDSCGCSHIETVIEKLEWIASKLKKVSAA